jgi:hypothetical protein
MANTIIQLKNSGIPGNVPSILQPGELAINYTDGKLFYGNSLNVATLFDAITEPSGLNGEIQFNDSGVFGASANLKYNTSTKTLSTDNILASVDITGNKLISNNSSGDEGGEILLAKPASNTTLDGVGITIDSYQNRIRFFEQGGSARGAYIDLTQAAGGVGTNLLDASADDLARLRANSAFDQANSATTTAQAGFNHANGAFGTANTKLNSSGGTISGDLIISGNLTITGNTVTHSADDFIVNDPIVLLANNNSGNLLDIGFVAHYEDGSANTKHTGLVRDVSAGVWYLFEDYIPHIQENNILNVSDASFRVSTLTANIVTNVITVRGVDPLDRANAAYNQANSTTTTAQAAFNTANSATATGQAGFNHANGAFSAANTKFDSAGGTISGNIAVTGIVTINTHAVLESTTITTASISQTTLDAFATATYRSAKYLVQMTSGSAYHMIELSLIHDGTTVHLSQYGEVKTGSSLGSFDASISSGTLSVLFTPTNAVTTVKAAITLLPV